MKVKLPSLHTPLKLYDIAKITFALMVIANCRGYRLLLPIKSQLMVFHIYKICTLISVAVGFIYIKRRSSLMKSAGQYICSSFLFVFIPQFFYTVIRYSQSIKDYFTAVDQYIFIIWIITFLYIFRKDNGIEKMMETILSILMLGYAIILIQGIMMNSIGISFMNVNRWGMVDGRIRILDLSSFWMICLVYCWNKILCGNATRKHYLSAALIVIVTFYIERGRVQIVAMLATLMVMALFDFRNKIKSVILWGLAIVSFIVAVLTGFFAEYINQFSVVNNGVSTINRLAELKYYLEQFRLHKIFGIGLVPLNNIYSLMDISSWGDMNPADIGIFGSLGVLGFGAIILFVLPLVKGIFVCGSAFKKNKEYAVLLIGIIAYLMMSSLTMVALNYTRIPALPLYFAIIFYCEFDMRKVCERNRQSATTLIC